MRHGKIFWLMTSPLWLTDFLALRPTLKEGVAIPTEIPGLNTLWRRHGCFLRWAWRLMALLMRSKTARRSDTEVSSRHAYIHVSGEENESLPHLLENSPAAFRPEMADDRLFPRQAPQKVDSASTKQTRRNSCGFTVAALSRASRPRRLSPTAFRKQSNQLWFDRPS